MKNWILIFVLMFLAFKNFGQDTIINQKGIITFKSSINYYVKLDYTGDLKIGDTLYKGTSGHSPIILIKHISSTSCLGSKLNNSELSVGDTIFARSKVYKNHEKELTHFSSPSFPSDSIPSKKTENVKPVSKYSAKNINGRIGISSYSTILEGQDNITNRFRYTLVYNVRQIDKSSWGLESYITFRHKSGAWQEIQSNIFNGLKIYNLALHYDAGRNTKIWLGRKVNLNASNIGAVDGLQIEKTKGTIAYGLMLGSRPDNLDYGFNFKLLQAGLYAAHNWNSSQGISLSNTIAFFEQRYSMKTDRRFLYFQHTSSLIKNLHLFASTEIDLYKKVENKQGTVFAPSSIFFSLRYKIFKKITLSTSYDALKNIIYYESYKNFIDQLIEQEVRQGLRFGASIDLWKFGSLSGNTGYRFQSNKKDPSKNADIFFSIYQIPLINIAATASVTYLKTDYISGILKGIRATKSLFNNLISIDAGVRSVNYSYTTSENPLVQKIMELGINTRLAKKMTLSLNSEATFDPNRNYFTVYSNLIKRF